MKHFILCFFVLLFPFLSFSQKDSTKKIQSIVMFSPSFGYQFAFGKHADFFTNNSRAAMNISYKFPSNITVGVEAAFMFGAEVKDLSLLGDMTNSNGFILGKNLTVEQPSLEGRGGHLNFEVGKIFTLSKKDPHSGIHLKGGLGYMFYSAYASTDFLNIPQLNNDYLNGYDRAMGGVSFSQYIGYTFFGSGRLLNFSLGIENIFAFTSSLRTWDFKENKSIENLKETKWMIGPKLYFTIPLYIKNKSYFTDNYFYN